MDNEADNKSPRSRFTVERVLLAAVLILQVGILLLLTSRSPSPARSEPGDTGDRPGSHASRRTLFNSAGQSSETAAYSASAKALLTPASPARHARAELDRMYERAVGDLEEMGRMANLDDGWDRLVAMPAFDVRDRGSAYHVRFSMPDGNVQGTELTLEGRVLTIGVAGPAQSRRGSMSVRYSRQIMLPGPVAEASDARAFVTNGLLYIVVPKASAAPVGQPTLRVLKVLAQ